MHKAETIFFQVLSDIRDYLHNLTLVGGWVPYIYATYLWKDTEVMPLTTSDIDFGVGEPVETIPPETIYEILLPGYRQRHISMDRMFPVVFHLENVEIHFLSTEDMPKRIIDKLMGRQINVSKVEYFDVLLRNRVPINVMDNKANEYTIYIPKPSAYIYHKGLTFVSREYEDAKAKDLHYIYYVLRFCPNLDEILLELKSFKKDKGFIRFMENMNQYFERISSRGCLMVEKENGPDDYVRSVREDAFDRFQSLIKYLE